MRGLKITKWIKLNEILKIILKIFLEFKSKLKINSKRTLYSLLFLYPRFFMSFPSFSFLLSLISCLHYTCLIESETPDL